MSSNPLQWFWDGVTDFQQKIEDQFKTFAPELRGAFDYLLALPMKPGVMMIAG
jgi:hypothetical protein